MTDYKAVIFDYGGVLLDWNPYHLLRKIMPNDTEIERFLQEISFKEWNYECDKGLSFSESTEELCRKFPHRADLLRIYNERWTETIGCVFEANVATLKALVDRGVPVYGLSNWSAEKFALVEPQHEFFTWFKDMAISGREKIAKPDARIYRLLLERNHLNAAECIYIDDSEVNVRAGRGVGLKCIQYGSSQQLTGELTQLGFSV